MYRILLFLLCMIFIPVYLLSETISNSMKTRRIFITNPSTDKLLKTPSVIFAAPFGYYTDVKFCCPHIRKSFQGILLDYQHRFTPNFNLEIITAAAGERDTVVDKHVIYSRKGFDDLITYFEYNPSPTTSSQAILYGFFGIPLWRSISKADLLNSPLVGTRTFSLGGGIEYSYLHSFKDMGIGCAFNGRILHYCSLSFGKCLPPDHFFHPGDQNDFVGEIHFFKQKHKVVGSFIYTNRWHIAIIDPARSKHIPYLSYYTFVFGYNYLGLLGSFFAGTSYTFGTCKTTPGWIFGFAALY